MKRKAQDGVVVFGGLAFLRWGMAALVMGMAMPAVWAAPPSMVAAHAPSFGATDSTCSITYNLPGDIGNFGADPPDQEDLDIYSWQLFLALNAPGVGKSVSKTGDNITLWGGQTSTPITAQNPGWSSTDDLLLAVTSTYVPAYGTHYYPLACQQVANYQSYRVLDEIAKVDDSFFEASVGRLSASPVVATNGTFLRYEILISPVTYNTVVLNQWYLTSVLNSLTSPLSFPCGIESAGGHAASPADTGIGAIVIKNAWMDATGFDLSKYHSEKILVFTPGAENSSGQDTCELKTMALVGMHIAHKTTQQSAWTWSTFEHAANAPDCTNVPPKGSQQGVPNLTCPTTGGSYNFFPSNPSDPRFQTCNATPATNAGTATCDDGFCADLAPNATAGYSRLCRQVPLQANYKTAYAQTQACNQATGSSSVWSNYSLISTQWFTNFGANPTCQNSANTVNPNSSHTSYAPQVLLSDGQSLAPFLANTSMESYERSVCMGCHQGAVTGKSNNLSTDLLYFLQLEVPAAPINQGTTKTQAKQ